MKAALVVAVLSVLAFAAGSRSQPSAPSCGPAGAAQGFATIRPFPANAAGRIQGSFSRNPFFFIRRFNCKGRGVEVRHIALGVYDVRFPGLRPRAISGVALTEGAVSAAMQPLSDIVRVRLFNGKRPVDGAFSVVVY